MARDYEKMRGSGRMEKSHDDYSKKSYGGMGGRKSYDMKWDLKDGAQASQVRSLPTMTEDDDMGRIRYDHVGSKGYAPEAFNYDYK
jgi:hypothetical protein